MDNGEEYVRDRVGVEATGKPFDATNFTDETLFSKHINPMVNMGAIAMCTMINGSNYEERFQRLLDLTRKLAGNPEIELDEAVYLSEKRTGNKNRALAYLLKSYGLIEDDDVESVLDCYFKACSIQVTCKDLARIAYVFSSHGKLPLTDERVFPADYAHFVNAVLVTCGMYFLGFANKGIIIYFGVLHCLGVCMLLSPLLKKLPWWVLIPVGLAVIFMGDLLKGVRSDSIFLIPFGIYPAGFASSDYFPLIPRLGYFILGIAMGQTLYKNKKSSIPEPKFFPFNALGFLGRHSLFIYLVHQPVIAALVFLVSLFI